MDSCGAYKWFNKTQHIAIECNSDESHMPGSFCMKVVQQGPKGFICRESGNVHDHSSVLNIFCFQGTVDGAKSSGDVPLWQTLESQECATGEYTRMVCTGKNATAPRTPVTVPRE